MPVVGLYLTLSCLCWKNVLTITELFDKSFYSSNMNVLICVRDEPKCFCISVRQLANSSQLCSPFLMFLLLKLEIFALLKVLDFFLSEMEYMSYYKLLTSQVNLFTWRKSKNTSERGASVSPTEWRMLSNWGRSWIGILNRNGLNRENKMVETQKEGEPKLK